MVEAVFEQLDVKQEVFRELDRICKAGAVLATNTSAIPVTQIAAVTARPESVVGTHFFSPVPMMKLCELVRGFKTSDETLATARAFAEEIGKTCIVVNRDVAGFVTTRLIAALVVEAVKLVESGVVSAADLDVACQLGFGHAMGPLATTDLTGVDVMLHATRNIYTDTADEKFFPPELLAAHGHRRRPGPQDRPGLLLVLISRRASCVQRNVVRHRISPPTHHAAEDERDPAQLPGRRLPPVRRTSRAGTPSACPGTST